MTSPACPTCHALRIAAAADAARVAPLEGLLARARALVDRLRAQRDQLRQLCASLQATVTMLRWQRDCARWALGAEVRRRKHLGAELQARMERAA